MWTTWNRQAPAVRSMIGQFRPRQLKGIVFEFGRCEVCFLLHGRQYEEMRMRLQTLILSICLVLSGCSETRRTYDLSCAQPPKRWGTQKEGIGHLRLLNIVKLDDSGHLTWNKLPISDDQLGKFMLQSGNLNPEPQLILEVTERSPCKRVETIRRIMIAAPICQGEYPLCSEGRNWRDWDEGTAN